MKKLMTVVLGLTCSAGMAGMVIAGQIDSPGAPGSAASKMPAVGDIYNYLTTGTPVPTPGTGFTEPSSSPASTGRTLTEIYAAVATPFPQCDAAAADVKAGKKFFCTQSGSWGVKTGTIATLLKTGQTSVYQTGDDGTYQKGAAFSYSWDSGSDTVKDNVTGLIWASNGAGVGCNSGAALNWSGAIVWAEGLSFAGYTDWRLPNQRELESLVQQDATLSAPYVNKTYFPGTVSNTYWSSTTSAGDAGYGLYVNAGAGAYGSTISVKTDGFYVRPVRGGN